MVHCGSEVWETKRLVLRPVSVFFHGDCGSGFDPAVVDVVNDGLKVLRVARLLRAMRVFRVFMAIRYSKSFRIIGNVTRASRESLVAVLVLALGYILISALIIFNVEPDSFNSFFDAVYWATVSLATVGYGDIYPVSKLGRMITMFSSIFGIAIVALPAGIITAGYMSEIQKETEGEEMKLQTNNLGFQMKN